MGKPDITFDPRTEDARQAIVDACREMLSSGLTQGTAGNVSVRSGDGILISPSAIPYEALVPSDIVWMGFDGTITGHRKPSSEWRFHLDILRARPEMNALVHAHPIYCTTLAIQHREIPPLHYMIAAAGGSTIPCAPYATFGTAELSAHACEALRDRHACLLAHHGMIALGRNLERAMWLAVEVETLAHQYFNCLQLGDVPLLSDEEIACVLEKMSDYGAG